MTLETLPLVDVTTSSAKAMREGSTKLSQLDKMLKGFRSRGQKAMVFCEMPEMMTLLQVFLHKHSHSFVCMDQGMTNSEKLAALNHFGANGVLVALVSTATTPPPTPPSAVLSVLPAHPIPEVANVVLFDSNWNNFRTESSKSSGRSPVASWCRHLRKRLNDPSELSVYRLACRGTVEDNISNKSLQKRLLRDIKRDGGGRKLGDNGARVWKIKRQTLEDLFSVHTGDNGLFNTDLKVRKLTNGHHWLLFFT